MKTPSRFLLAGSILTLLAATTTSGQNSSEFMPQTGYQDKVSVGYVFVPVIARSANGYIQGLTAEDFELKVDGQPVHFESFEVGANAPVSVIFLQDLSGSMANSNKLRLSRLAIERILNGGRMGDQFALASFVDGRLALEVPYTTEADTIDKAMGAWHPYGVTALHDAVSGLPELTESLQSAKRAAILITDGADNASQLEPREARRRVRQAELPVYVLGMSTGSPETLDREGNKLHRFADVLNLLAHLTGGQYFWISEVEDIVHATRSILSDLRYQYVLGFSTTDSGRSRYRPLEVTTRKKNVRLSFRRGYEGYSPRTEAEPAN